MTAQIHDARVLITGGAGFIGSHLSDALLASGNRVVALDNFHSFYNPAIKRENVRANLNNERYRLVEGDIRSEEDLKRAFAHGPFDVVVHLAALAGVRPSLMNPAAYMDVNVLGTQRLVDEMLRSSARARLVFGSSSSVYGQRSGEAFVEDDRVDRPLSPYAASKAANEAQLHAVHHTTGMKIVCLRFFTVFGPRQRPDLAIHKFFHAIDRGEPIELYGDGSSKRDYTFVSDIVSGITAAVACDKLEFEIINLGRGQPVMLSDMVSALESACGKQAEVEHKPMPPGDVPYTHACIDKARRLLGYEPETPFADGIAAFVEWYRRATAEAAAAK